MPLNTAQEIPPERIQELVSVVLGNPYDPHVRAQRQRLEVAGLLPGGRRHGLDFKGLEAWWARFPEVMMPLMEESLLVPLVLWSEQQKDLVDDAKRLARFLPDQSPDKYMELTARSLIVKARLDRIVGNSAAMEKVRRQAWAASFGKDLRQTLQLSNLIHSTPVFISGETGTGKELVAQAILASAPGRWTKKGRSPAVSESLHLGAMPDELVQSALFGHKRGAFTGADKDRPGILERCHEGAVFLDEVGDLPAQAQVGLLRTLQEGKARPLGSDEDVDASPRIVSATHRNLLHEVYRGGFRLDLYHRLVSSVQVELPPLRDRREDLLPLVTRCLRDLRVPKGSVRDGLQGEIKAWLEEHDDYWWPGNVRELMAIVRAKALGVEPFISDVGEQDEIAEAVPDEIPDGAWTLDELKNWYVQRMLAKHGGNLSRASRALGVNRATVARWRDREETK